MEKQTIVVVSGYFNPVHKGHIKLFKDAKKLGTRLIVIVNNDKQVKLKNSVPFMNEVERAFIIENLKPVDIAYISIDTDKTVCKSLENLFTKTHHNVLFVNGGDRKSVKDIPEAKICKKLGIKMVFNVGGKKTQSSSSLLSKVKKHG